MSDFWNKCKEFMASMTSATIGNGLIFTGEHMQKAAMIAIAIGALLIICRNTKVLRWGFISYMAGLLIELIGIALIK